jgi:hypothetical protein
MTVTSGQAYDVQGLWVPRTVSPHLTSIFTAGRSRSHSLQVAQHDRSPWPFDSHPWRSST